MVITNNGHKSLTQNGKLVFLRIASGYHRIHYKSKTHKANSLILLLTESAKQRESCFARNPVLLWDV